jgi:hypothetical protein
MDSFNSKKDLNEQTKMEAESNNADRDVKAAANNAEGRGGKPCMSPKSVKKRRRSDDSR